MKHDFSNGRVSVTISSEAHLWKNTTNHNNYTHKFKKFKIGKFVELNIRWEQDLVNKELNPTELLTAFSSQKRDIVFTLNITSSKLGRIYYSLLRAQHNYYHKAVYPSQTMAITDLVRKCPVSSCLQLDIYPCCGHCPFC